MINEEMDQQSRVHMLRNGLGAESASTVEGLKSPTSSSKKGSIYKK